MTERERLKELLLSSDPIKERDLDDDWGDGELDEIVDHLLTNGVIVPPCKIGDILYVISRMSDKRILPFINEYEVTSITIKKKSFVIWHEMDGYIKNFKQNDFGKTIFLTKEAAEQAIAKMKGGAE